MTPSFEILEFGNQTTEDKKLLNQFVTFHWDHYRDDAQYIPLLDYEYLGFRLIGMTGFFEPKNLFFKHAEMRWFLARRDGKIVGRCNAFVNSRHNAHWHDKTGFFGQFECIEEQAVADALLESAKKWLKSKGMEQVRGPQNLPVNEATPGVLTGGFDSRPVVYYHYNKPYYAKLIAAAGFDVVNRVLSWEQDVASYQVERLDRLIDRIIQRYEITAEPWDARPLAERKKEMLDIYNDAWNDNFGFVPFTKEEFEHIVDDMMLVMKKDLFTFLYVKGEPAAFFGGVLNIFDVMKPSKIWRRFELFRAVKMLLMKNRVKGFRLGYLGVKRKFRRIGLDGVLLKIQRENTQRNGYQYSDLGWVLENNEQIIKTIEWGNPKPSKTYTIYQASVE